MSITEKAVNTGGVKGGVKGEVVKPNTAVAGEKGAKKKTPSEIARAMGEEIYASMDEKQREGLGSMSKTLHFKHLLGLQSKKSSRRVAQGHNEVVPLNVGQVFVTDVAIKVPDIDITLNNTTGIDPEKDIKWRDVGAGETFFLTDYEMLFFLIQDQYACECTYEGRERDAYMSAKMKNYMSKESKLPTPFLSLRSKAIKSNIVTIDEQNPDGTWKIKDEYKDKFGPLLNRVKPRRGEGGGGGRSKVPTATVVSLALKKMLYSKPEGK